MIWYKLQTKRVSPQQAALFCGKCFDPKVHGVFPGDHYEEVIPAKGDYCGQCGKEVKRSQYRETKIVTKPDHRHQWGRQNTCLVCKIPEPEVSK